MKAAVRVNQFSGAVLIAKHDSIIYKQNFGTLDFANTKLIDSNSMFELGIVTEEFTAAAILILKDEGKLRLTDPVTKYLSQLPYKNVTIRHLLTHTSGLPDYYDEVMKDKWGTNKYATNDDMITALASAKVPLAWQPGTHYNESHYYTDYPLLAAIIEKVSGLTFANFIQQKIFTPLRMQRTKILFTDTTAQDANTAESVYFDESKQQFFPADSFTAFPLEYKYVAKQIQGGKGISSTSYDLFLWDRSLQNHTLLSTPSHQEMFAPAILKDTVSQIFMGYGILAGKNEFGNYVQQRDGGNNETLGYIATHIHYAKDDCTIILLANKAKSSSAIAGTLAYIVFGREVVLPYIHKLVSIDTSVLNKYVGDYMLPAITKIYKKDGTLWMTVKGEPDLKLLPESDTKFFSADKEYDWQVEFQLDNKGNIVKSYFIFSGLKKEAKKL